MNKRLIAMAAPIVAISAGWYVAYERPMQAKANDTTEQLASTNSQLNVLKRQLESVKSKTVAQADVDAAAAAVAGWFPTDLGLGEFILQSEAAAKATGITVISIDTVNTSATRSTPTPAPTAKPSAATTTVKNTKATTPARPAPTAPAPAAGSTPGVTTTPLSIVAKGESLRLVDYLKRLQEMSRVVMVDDIEVTNDNKGSAELTLSVRLFSRPN